MHTPYRSALPPTPVSDSIAPPFEGRRWGSELTAEIVSTQSVAGFVTPAQKPEATGRQPTAALRDSAANAATSAPTRGRTGSNGGTSCRGEGGSDDANA
jgi:hypothetical protein